MWQLQEFGKNFLELFFEPKRWVVFYLMDATFGDVQGYDMSIVGTAVNECKVVEVAQVLFYISQTFIEIKPYDFIGHIVTASLRTEHHAADTVGLGI